MQPPAALRAACPLWRGMQPAAGVSQLMVNPIAEAEDWINAESFSVRPNYAKPMLCAVLLYFEEFYIRSFCCKYGD